MNKIQLMTIRMTGRNTVHSYEFEFHSCQIVYFFWTFQNYLFDEQCVFSFDIQNTWAFVENFLGR